MAIVSKSDTSTWARAFLEQERLKGVWWKRWRGAFYRWKLVGIWEPIDDESARALFGAFLGTLEAQVPAKDSSGYVSRPLPNNNKGVTELEGAVKRACVISPHQEAPAWLSLQEGRPPPEDILPFRGGWLDVRSGRAHKPTPDLFNLHAVDYVYDPHAPEPRAWLSFLEAQWPEDAEAQQTIQEWFGYCLTSDTRLQKMLLLVGAKGAGKGTIGRLLCALCGEASYVSAGLADLGRPFGLEAWVGKTVAIFPDARLQGRTDNNVLLEKLLSIVGQDPQTIDRKYAQAWRGTLTTRLTLIGNLTPEISDNTGAFKRRLIALEARRSFAGKEDINLGEKLRAERPGILLWALAGLRRLRDRGAFIQPASGLRLLQTLEEKASPVQMFVKEELELGASYETDASDVWERWVAWRSEQGLKQRAMDPAWLAGEIQAAFPEVEKARVGTHPRRRWIFRGCRMLEPTTRSVYSDSEGWNA